MSKRLISFLLAFIMVIGSFTPAFANGIIIGGDESEDTTIIKEENINNDISIYEDEKPGQSSKKNNSEGLESSIVIQSDEVKNKKQTETPSSLVIDNNNTEIKDQLEISQNKVYESMSKSSNSGIASLIEKAEMTITTIKDGVDYNSDFVFNMEENKSRLLKRNISIKTKKTNRDIMPGEFVIEIPLITNKYSFYAELDEEKWPLQNGSLVSAAENTGFDYSIVHEDKDDGKTFIVLTNKDKIISGNSVDLNFAFTEKLSDEALTSNKSYETFIQVDDLIFNKMSMTYHGIPIEKIIKSNNDIVNISTYTGSINDEFFNFNEKYNANNYFISKLDSFYYGFLLRDISDTKVLRGQNSDEIYRYRQVKPDTISLKDPRSTAKCVIFAPQGSVLSINGKDFIEEQNGKIIMPYKIAADQNIAKRLLVPKKYAKTQIVIKVGYEDINFKDSDSRFSFLSISNVSLPDAKNYDFNQKKVDINYIYSSLKGNGNGTYGITKGTSFENFYYQLKNYPKFSQEFNPGVYFDIDIISPIDLELFFDGYILKNKNNDSEFYFLPVVLDKTRTYTYLLGMPISTNNGGISQDKKYLKSTKKEGVYCLKLVYKNLSGTIKNVWNNSPYVRNVAISIPNNLTEEHFNNNEWELFSKVSYKIKDSKTGETIKPNFKQSAKISNNLMNFLDATNKELYGEEALENVYYTDYLVFNINKFKNTLNSNNSASFDFIEEKNGKLYFETIITNYMHSSMFNGKKYNVEFGLNEDNLILEDIVSVNSKSYYKNIDSSIELEEVPEKYQNKIKATFIDKNEETTDTREFYDGASNLIAFSTKAIYSIDKNIYNQKLSGKNGGLTVGIQTEVFIEQNEKEIDNNPCITKDNVTYLPYVDTGNMQYAISEVKTNDSKKFVNQHALININETYDYKLSIASGSIGLSDVVIYNELENAEPGFLKWQGDLIGIDCQEAEGLGYKIDVFASYKYKNNSLDKDADWIPFKSADLSKVKTLAFKISKSTSENNGLAPKESLSVYIKMKTPEESKIAKFEGKPTHAYNNMYTEWKPENSNEKTGIRSNTTKVSFHNSITDDVPARVNHQIKISRSYSNDFTEEEIKDNRIVILTDIKTGNKYMTSGNTLACVEPGKYNVSYITKKGVIADGDKTVEIIEEYKDSVNTINVNYKLDDLGSSDGPGYVDEDLKENLFKITVTSKEEKIIHIR